MAESKYFKTAAEIKAEAAAKSAAAKPFTESVTELYWKFDSIDQTSRKIQWTHSVSSLCEQHELTKNALHTLLKHHPCPVLCGLVCLGCGCALKWTPTGHTTRFHYEQAFVTLQVYCDGCWANVQQEREKAKQAQAQAEKEQAERELKAQQEKRAAAQEKYGERFVGDCPNCDGFAVIKLNNNTLRPFIACSSYHPRRNNCGYAERLPTMLDEIKALTLFKSQLNAEMLEGLEAFHAA